MSRRLPTPLVLTLSSVMISIGVVAVMSAASSSEDSASDAPPSAAVDTSSPATAAESFLDAWRKRDHEGALALSVGPARQAARTRAERDEEASPEAQELKARLWDELAKSRLTLQIEQSDQLDPGRVQLTGTAEGTFVSRPYRREVQFVVVQIDGAWKVERMDLGEILTEMPRIFGGGREDPQRPDEATGEASP